jgi:hypothetical protein
MAVRPAGRPPVLKQVNAFFASNSAVHISKGLLLLPQIAHLKHVP